MMSPTKQSMPDRVLVVNVKNVGFCIDIRNVTQVLQLTSLKPVPNTPNYYAGLMNFHGESIPVIDLALRLKLLHADKYTLNTPIIICESNAVKIGLIVDKLVGIEKVGNESFEYHQEFNSEDSLFIATVLTGKEILLLLSIERLKLHEAGKSYD